eukprot:scaffold1088_cov90-Cylindrotheca_fusiformis.AAC.1
MASSGYLRGGGGGGQGHQHHPTTSTTSSTSSTTSTLNINARKDGRLNPELADKIERWLISFHRLDPRYKILKFFNQVASEGADDFVDEEDDEDGEIADYELTLNGADLPSRRDSIVVRLKKRLGTLFDKSSILTVWRPCSNDAMRKMMEGTGVGKGLDIKGKSAKKGLLSAFVPFLQISNEADKYKIMPIPYNARLRVYYQTEQARTQVWKRLQQFGEEHEHNYAEDEDITSAAEQSEEMNLLNDYTKTGKYGIEVGQRLFWYAVVVSQDITRTDDLSTDGTATGRASSPAFQDANMDTLKKATKYASTIYNNHNHRGATTTTTTSAPVAVLLQYDKDHSMRPQTLVVAYEENGQVIPVVSDFDCFLLGWRREALWLGCNLPRDQEDLMMWCVDKIEEVLSDCHLSSDPWTVRWLEVKKEAHKAGINFDSPPYGYGDPKSYGIMEKAAQRLKDTGAVRHGSECFNYGFPQEIDETFLLVSDTLETVPWRYLNVMELQNLLLTKIQEGFVFPLNPKWILCDPGWKNVYDHLMDSKALYADSCRDVWYPPGLGIRKRIEKICSKYPNGFRRGTGRVSFIASKGYSPLRQVLEQGGEEMSGNAYFELAELELEQYSRKHTLARQIAKASEAASTDDDDSESDAEVKRRKSNNKFHKLELYRRDKRELVKLHKQAEDIIEMTNSNHGPPKKPIRTTTTTTTIDGIQSERPKGTATATRGGEEHKKKMKGRRPL